MGELTPSWTMRLKNFCKKDSFGNFFEMSIFLKKGVFRKKVFPFFGLSFPKVFHFIFCSYYDEVSRKNYTDAIISSLIQL